MNLNMAIASDKSSKEGILTGDKYDFSNVVLNEYYCEKVRLEYVIKSRY